MTPKKRIRTLHSALGPVEIVYVDVIRTEDGKEMPHYLGYCSFTQRRIQIKTGLHAQQEAHTLRHEWTHLVLWDSGVSHFLSYERTEAICDAIATALIDVALK